MIYSYTFIKLMKNLEWLDNSYIVSFWYGISAL